MDEKHIAERIAKSVESAITPKLVKEIEKLTAQNDHSEAVVRLAEGLKDMKLRSVAQAIQTVHGYVGSMPKQLQDIRYDLLKQLLKKAEQKLSPEEYKALYMAF